MRFVLQRELYEPHGFNCLQTTFDTILVVFSSFADTNRFVLVIGLRDDVNFIFFCVCRNSSFLIRVDKEVVKRSFFSQPPISFLTLFRDSNFMRRMCGMREQQRTTRVLLLIPSIFSFGGCETPCCEERERERGTTLTTKGIFLFKMTPVYFLPHLPILFFSPFPSLCFIRCKRRRGLPAGHCVETSRMSAPSPPVMSLSCCQDVAAKCVSRKELEVN